MSVEAVIDRINSEATTAGSAPAATTAAPPTAQETKPPEQKPVEGQPPVEEKPVAAVEEPEEELDIEAPSEASGDFEEFKPVFESHPALKSKLKQIIGREKAFSDMAPNGSMLEMREILTRVPTVEDAEAIVEQAENHATMAESFRSDPVAFIESLKESDAPAFTQLATQLPEILADTDPRLYQEQARLYTNRVMTNVMTIAQQSGDEEFMKAAQIISNYLGIQPAAAQAPRARGDSEAARLRRQIAERDEAEAEAQFQTFWSQTDEAIINNSVSEIEKTVKTALPNATEKQIKKIIGEIWDTTLETLNAQPQFRSQLDNYRNSAQRGRRALADHKAIVDFGTRRAKLVIPKVARAVISEWSRNIIQASNSATEKKKEIAATTRDAGSGPQGTTSSTATNGQTNGQQKKSFNSIFSRLENEVLAARGAR